MPLAAASRLSLKRHREFLKRGNSIDSSPLIFGDGVNNRFAQSRRPGVSSRERQCCVRQSRLHEKAATIESIKHVVLPYCVRFYTSAEAVDVATAELRSDDKRALRCR